MSIHVAVNGFGRIGRLVFRNLVARPDVFQVVGVNDLADVRTMAILLKYDSTYRRFPGTVDYDDRGLIVNGRHVPVARERDPVVLPWGDYDVDVVLESTGVFRRRRTDAKPGFDSHLAASATRIVISAPANDPDFTCIIGVNHQELRPKHRCISSASPAACCIAPIAKVLDDRFGIRRGFVTAMHACTNDQVLQDSPHKDLYRGAGRLSERHPNAVGPHRAGLGCYSGAPGETDWL